MTLDASYESVNYPAFPLCKGVCSLVLKYGEKKKRDPSNLPNSFAFSCIEYTLSSALKQIPLLKSAIHNVVADSSTIGDQDQAHDIGIAKCRTEEAFLRDARKIISENIHLGNIHLGKSYISIKKSTTGK